MAEENGLEMYEKLLADLRAKKEQQIRELTERFDNAIAAIELLLGTGAASAPLAPVTRPDDVTEIRIAVGEFHGMSITNAARQMLQKTNRRPLRTEQIIRYLEQSGRKIEGKNPIGAVYSSLKRNDDFELVAPNTWGLAEWYNIKRKSKNASERAVEIMREGPTSIAAASARAEQEIEAEKEPEKKASRFEF